MRPADCCGLRPIPVRVVDEGGLRRTASGDKVGALRHSFRVDGVGAYDHISRSLIQPSVNGVRGALLAANADLQPGQANLSPHSWRTRTRASPPPGQHSRSLPDHRSIARLRHHANIDLYIRVKPVVECGGCGDPAIRLHGLVTRTSTAATRTHGLGHAAGLGSCAGPPAPITCSGCRRLTCDRIQVT